MKARIEKKLMEGFGYLVVLWFSLLQKYTLLDDRRFKHND